MKCWLSQHLACCWIAGPRRGRVRRNPAIRVALRAGNDGWRLNDDAHDTLTLRDGGTDRPVNLIYRRDGYRLELPGGAIEASGQLADDGNLSVDLGGRRTSARPSSGAGPISRCSTKAAATA